MFSYLESRGGKFPSTVFFGLQYYLKRYLSQRITVEQVDEAKQFAEDHGVPFNYEGWLRIADQLEGKIPVRIRAVPEGSVVPTGNILMSVESTDPESFWVVSWLETVLVRLWYPITVATLSYYTKQRISAALEATGGDVEAEVGFKLHDFGSRGVSSQESAAIGGAAHLVNFNGSDTIAGIHMANKFYNHKMSGFSIPASEHSTMTMWGRDKESDAYANMLEQYKDQPIFACVSDSYDLYAAASNIWGHELKAKVLQYKGTLVIRPDSGDPKTVCLELLKRLETAFGATVNEAGFKVLNDNVRIIQGDGVNYDSIGEILTHLEQAGFSATNIAFGMGGGLLQQINRDTQRFAFKCSSATIDGKEVDVYKDPATDLGKRSKRGRLELHVEDDGAVRTVRREQFNNSLLRDVYLNGEILVDDNFEEVRANTRTPYGSFKLDPSTPTH
jgi:nicotinamide phosphoribosyltransferase